MNPADLISGNKSVPDFKTHPPSSASALRPGRRGEEGNGADTISLTLVHGGGGGLHHGGDTFSVVIIVAVIIIIVMALIWASNCRSSSSCRRRLVEVPLEGSHHFHDLVKRWWITEEHRATHRLVILTPELALLIGRH